MQLPLIQHRGDSVDFYWLWITRSSNIFGIQIWLRQADLTYYVNKPLPSEIQIGSITAYSVVSIATSYNDFCFPYNQWKRIVFTFEVTIVQLLFTHSYLSMHHIILYRLECKQAIAVKCQLVCTFFAEHLSSIRQCTTLCCTIFVI